MIDVFISNINSLCPIIILFNSNKYNKKDFKQTIYTSI